MRGTLRLVTILGIPIRLHWSFLAFFPILVWVVASSYGQSILWGAVLYALLFACVALHELAHSVVAQSYSLRVREIVLLPFGGVASMERIPEEPGREAAIAIAGPVFNMAVAALLFAFMWLVPGIIFDLGAIWNNPPLQAGVVAIFWVNIIMALFNLLPALPMDGGRLFRAFLVAMGMPYVRATSTAVLVSKGVLILFIVLGFQMPMLWIIAFFVYYGATGEEQAVRARSSLKQLNVSHLLPQNRAAVEPDMPLGEVLPLLLPPASQRHFPVLQQGELVGVLSYQDFVGALKRNGGSDTAVSAVMRPAVAVSPEESLAEVQQRLEGRGLPVACILDRGELVGLVAQDELRRLSNLLELESD